MNIALQIVVDINKLKAGLIEKAKKGGRYSHFGQKEVKKLKKKYVNNEDNTNDRVLNLITDFSKWCKSFSQSDLRGL